MKVGLSITIIIIICLIGGIYLVSQNSNNNNEGMHMMNGHMMSNNMRNNNIVQSHRTYTMKLISLTNNLQPNHETKIIYKIVDEQGNVLKNFELNHTKLMHFIVVRQDLQEFQHLHPDLNKDTGEFTIPVTFPDAGKYRLFADFSPSGTQKDAMGMTMDVTSFRDVNVGNVSQYIPQNVTFDTQSTKIVDGYQIDYSLPQQITAGREAKIMLHITKDGQPVTDMEEYLGAQAHGILLRRDTLDYAHIHAIGTSMTHMMGNERMTMDVEGHGPDITFSYTFPSSGIYKFFTQYQVSGRVVTTDYTMNVK